MQDDLNNRVGKRRRELGLTQEALAERVGVTRQTLGAVESGRSAPSTAIALRLARELSSRVEDLFWVDDGGDEIQAYLAAGSIRRVPDSSPVPVALGRIGGRWIAHAVAPGDLGTAAIMADGQVHFTKNSSTKVLRTETWADIAELSSQVLIAGCAPPLGLLEKQTAGLTHGRVRWLSRPSLSALDLLLRKEVHVAGLHVPGSGDEYNLEIIRRTFAPGSVKVTTLASWNVGLVAAPGNPRGIEGIECLRRPDLRLVDREPEAGAQLLLLQECLRAGIDPATLNVSVTARSHLEVAQAVKFGAAHVGVTVEGVARSQGLHFIPLAKERFDLVYPTELESDELLTPALDALATGRFRRSLEASGCYDIEKTGARLSL